MKRIVSLIVVAMAFLVVACDALSTRPGSFVVVFQWETGHEPDTEAKDYYLWAYYQEWKGGEGKEFPADIEANAKSLNETGPVKLASGATLDFSELTYGDDRFVRAAIWDNEERTGDPLYIGISELFDFKATDRNKVVAVNMKLQANAGIDETGEGGSFAIEIRQDGAPVERVPVTTVTLRFTIKNADTVVIANDLTFEKGLATLKLADLTQIDETTYEYGPWDITTGWEGLGDTTYSVFGKSRNTLGYESDPKKAEVFLDTTAPVPSITPFPAVAKLGDTVEVRFSFDEEVLPEALELNWRWLEFTLIENKENKSYTFSHTVTVDDPESTADFTLRATDLVGNATDHLPLGAVTIDRTAPWVEGAVIDATDDKEALKSGDVLTVSFTASEELSADPLLKIDDRTLTLDTKDDEERTYTYSYTVADNDISGFKTITASLRDPAGNDATVGLGFAIFDLTAPTLMGIAVSPGGAPGRAGTGGKISVVFTASEPLTTVTFDNDGLSFDHAVSLDGLTHTYTYGVTATDDERTYDFSVSGYDTAGNELTTMPLGSVEIDVTPPGISTYDLSHTHVRLGEQFTLSFTASDPLGSAPVVLVGAKNISAECTADDLVYTCTHTAAADEGDGVKQIALQLADIAGNNTNLTLKDTVDQYVTINYDVTAPDIVNPVIAPEKANLGATVDVRFSFTEDVAGVVIDWGALDGLFTRDPSNEGNTRLFIYKRQIAETDPEGEFPITVTAATDLAGNPITTAIPIGSLEIDRTAPEAKFPSVAVNDDTGKTLAKEGDTVTVSFTVEEDIQEYKVRIGLIAVSACTFDDDDQRYTCTHTVQGSDSEGMKDVTVELKDLAGNAETYPLGQVSFDMTEAELANAIILPTKSNKATVKTEVKFSFTEEVVMTALADGGLGLSGADCPLNGDPRRDFICEYAFDTDDTQVHDYPVTVSATDRAGNPSIDLVVGTVSVDRDIPSLLAQDVDPTTLKLGDQFTISFTSSETLEGDPIVKVGALQLGAPTTHEGDDYTYTHIAGAGEGDGDKLISVTLTDPAGNGRTIDLAKTVTYDTTAPTVLNPTVSPETANLQAEAIDVRFSFPEDVEAVTLTGLKLSGDAGAPGSAPFICIEQGSAKSWRCAVSLIGIPWDIAEYELWVNGRDLAGNYINPADETNGQELGLNAVIDRKRPVISGEVVTQCTGTNCAVPKSPSRIGDVVRVSFEIDETPPNDPIVAIAGRLATACSGTKTYNYCILVQSDDGDGEKDIRIETADKAGNITIKTLAVKPLFDVTAPKVTNPVISPNPAAATSVVSLSFSFSEPIPVARMSVTSTSGQATPFSCSSSDDISYLCTRAVAPADGSGYSIVVNATDAAGNPLSNYPAGTLSIDRDMPGVVLTQATPTTINLSVNTLTIQFEVNETPAANPILRIGADTISTIPVVEDITPGKRYTYSIPITHTESEGVKKATAEVYDAAGNHYYAELTYALGGSPDLIYDFTVPRVITRSASPERANVTALGVQMIASFSEPVYKPAIGTLRVQKNVGGSWVNQPSMLGRVSVENRPVGYTHALYFDLIDFMIVNDGEYRIHMEVTDEHGNTQAQEWDGEAWQLLSVGQFRVDMTVPLIDQVASIARICTEPTDLNPGETDFCVRPGSVVKQKAKSGDTIYYKLVFDRSDPYYEFDDIKNVWPTVEVSGIGPLNQLSQITYSGDDAPYTFIYRYKVSGSDTEDISSNAIVSLEDSAGNTLRNTSDDLVRTDVTNPTLVAYSTTPAYTKVGVEVVVNFTLSESVTSVSFNGAGLAFIDGCTTSDNISYRCKHTVVSGDSEGTKNFSATATDPTGNTSASFSLGSTVIDKTLPTPNVTSFVISTNSGFQLPDGTHAVADGHIVSVETVFTTTETLGKTPVVQIGGTDMTSVACAVPATNKYCFRRTVSHTEGAGLKPLALITEDRAGNISTSTGATWQIVYDFSAPRIVSVLFERTPNFAPARDSANQIQYYSIRDPYTNEYVIASLTLYADEEVAAGPTLSGFNLGVATVSTDEVYYSRTLSDSDTAGTYELAITWSDRLGNSTTLGIPWRMAIDKSEPTSIDGEKVTFTRKPWGTDESGGLPSFSLAAGIGTIIDTDISMIQAIAPNGLLVGTASRQGDGSFSIDELTTSDVPVIYLNPVKRTGMRIAYAPADPGATLEPARHVDWHATLNGKVPYSMLENPLVMVKTRRFMPHLDQGDEEPTAPELQGVMSNDGSTFSHTTGYNWQRMDEGNHPLWRMGQQLLSEMVIDPNTGTVYSVGGWYWTGATPPYGNPTEYIDNLYTYNLTTDRANDPDPNGNKPPAQAHHGTLYDDINDVLVVFGGKLYGPTNDLYFYYPAVNRWYLIEPTGTLPPARNHMGIAHDRKRDRYIIWGGSPDSDTSNLLADMWEYDRVANEWNEVTQNGAIPSIRRGAKMVYDSRRHRLLLFGGQTASYTLLNDLYEFDIDTATWYALTPSGTGPVVQMAAQGAYDGRYQKMYLFGGVTGTGPSESDIKQSVFAYDILRNEWSQLATTTHKIRMVYDPTNSRLVLIGRHYEDMTYLYQRQTVSLPGGVSTTFTYGTNTPSARFGSTVVYDKNGNRTFMYGGTDSTGTLNELWQYDHASNQWTQLTNSGWPGLTARVFAAGAFDLNRNSILIHGGMQNYYGGTYYSDFVEYTLSTGGWNPRTPTGTGPGARAEHAMAYDEVSGRTYIFGGSDAVTFYWNPGNPGSWSQIAAPAGLAARTKHTFVYAHNATAANRRIYMYGGYPDTQVWALAPATNTWTQIDSEVPEVGTRILHGMTYDSDRGRALLFGGGSTGDLWEFLPNTTWTKYSYLDGDPSSRNYARMVYSPTDKAAMVFYGNEGIYPSTALGDWYRLDTGYNSRAALVVSAPLSVLGIPANATIDRIAVAADAGGRGYHTNCSSAIYGATLHGWHHSGWRSLAANTSSSTGLLSVSITDDEVLRSMTRNRDNQLYFALTPTAPARCGSSPGQVTVDYIETVISYRIGEPAVTAFDPVDYYVSTGSISTGWQGARDACLDRGMDLVVINSEAERQFLATLSGYSNSAYYWIGLNDNLKADDWRWVSGDLIRKGNYSTGRAFDGSFDYWYSTSYPTSSTSNCVNFRELTYSGGWYNTSCTSTTRRYICEKPRNKFHHQFDTTTLDREDAESACVEIGGHLSILDNELDQMSIEKYQTTNLNYWIGLDDLATEGTFVWENGVTAWSGTVTGFPYGYTNWNDIQPDGNGDGVIASGADNFRWGDVDEAGTNYYTCEMTDTNCARNNASCEDKGDCCSETCHMASATCVACINTEETSCTTSAGCCNALDTCSSGKCCRNTGVSCTSVSQCCSSNHLCQANVCCLKTSARCTLNAQCCSGVCAGTLLKYCQ